MSIFRDELMEMISQWTEDQLTNYINKLETRVKETETWLRELRKMRALRKRALTKDNGPRSGG